MRLIYPDTFKIGGRILTQKDYIEFGGISGFIYVFYREPDSKGRFGKYKYVIGHNLGMSINFPKHKKL